MYGQDLDGRRTEDRTMSYENKLFMIKLEREEYKQEK